jgi:hypothetical protein
MVVFDSTSDHRRNEPKGLGDEMKAGPNGHGKYVD